MNTIVTVTAEINAINIFGNICGLQLKKLVATSDAWLNNPYTEENGLFEIAFSASIFAQKEELALLFPGTKVEVTLINQGNDIFVPSCIKRIKRTPLAFWVLGPDTRDRHYRGKLRKETHL